MSYACFHGLLSTPSGSVEYRFGFSALLGFIWTSQLSVGKSTRRAWPFRPIDRKFVHLQGAALNLAHKLERAAAMYAEKASLYAEAVLTESEAQREEELAILLDAIVVYLRILPDLLAGVTPYLYPRHSPPSHSFRDHLKWFTNPSATVDPSYAEILDRHRKWFELLAGKNPKGIRDLLVHRFGRFQFPVMSGSGSARGQVSADLVSTAGYHVDANELLPSITSGLFAFLDEYVIHFNDKIIGEARWAPFQTNDGQGSAIMHFTAIPTSSWLIPVVRSRA